MSEKITVPTLGESVTEATVSKWLKSQGDKVIADEPIVELETDKVNVEVPSPSNGVLGTITVKEGQTVNVGSILGIINNNINKVSKNDEIKNYNPPKKITKSITEKEKRLIPKKQVTKTKIEEPVLRLDEESIEEQPLVLGDDLLEKKSNKKNISDQKRKKDISVCQKIG